MRTAGYIVLYLRHSEITGIDWNLERPQLEAGSRALPWLADRGGPLMSATPTVGAVVVNYNGGERALRTLAALHGQNYPLREIIVVDNGSRDGTPELIRRVFPFVRVLDLGDNRGLTIARNRGLRELGTTLALVLDHDVYVAEDCIANLVRAHLAEQVTVVCPRIRLVPERDIVQTDGAAVHFLGGLVMRNGFQPSSLTPAIPGCVGGAIGACMLMQREQVIAAGGFDELMFFYQEDLEFSLRMRTAGHRIWCETSAEVFHERADGTPGLSFRGSGPYPKRRAYLMMRHRLATILIHYRLRTLFVLFPVLLLSEIAGLASAAKKGWAAQWFRAWWWQFTNAAHIGSRRRRVQRLRTVDDKDLLDGGQPPIAHGYLAPGGAERRLFNVFSSVVNGYWQVARNWIG
jgi:GT2 family glycosyltransferase